MQRMRIYRIRKRQVKRRRSDGSISHPSVAVLLFLLEPEFAMLSPIEIKGEVYFLVPRF